ncbi:hypothetical protein ABVK25_012552 [Lepraria finkii]|uniref:Uncharacterized protein n=1 Tax=Lepraria finkii TaxID=1340010 RepID=A0ABR4AG54_9LECA
MPVTPEQTHTKEFSDMFEEDTTLSPVGDRRIDALPVPNMTPTGKKIRPIQSPSSGSTPAGDKTVDPFTSSIEIATTAIDPPLLRSQPLPSGVPSHPSHHQQQEKISSAQARTNLSANSPLGRAATSAPPATTSYYASLPLLYGSHIFPYNRCSITAAYLGMKVITQGGWSRTITQADCGITDAFMVLLEERGFALAEQPGEQWIDEGLAVKQMCCSLGSDGHARRGGGR